MGSNRCDVYCTVFIELATLSLKHDFPKRSKIQHVSIWQVLCFKFIDKIHEKTTTIEGTIGCHTQSLFKDGQSKSLFIRRYHGNQDQG